MEWTATYLINIQQSAKESVVFLAQVLHLTVSRMLVTFRPFNRLLHVVVASSGIDSASHL